MRSFRLGWVRKTKFSSVSNPKSSASEPQITQPLCTNWQHLCKARPARAKNRARTVQTHTEHNINTTIFESSHVSVSAVVGSWRAVTVRRWPPVSLSTPHLQAKKDRSPWPSEPIERRPLPGGWCWCWCLPRLVGACCCSLLSGWDVRIVGGFGGLMVFFGENDGSRVVGSLVELIRVYLNGLLLWSSNVGGLLLLLLVSNGERMYRICWCTTNSVRIMKKGIQIFRFALISVNIIKLEY